MVTPDAVTRGQVTSIPEPDQAGAHSFRHNEEHQDHTPPVRRGSARMGQSGTGFGGDAHRARRSDGTDPQGEPRLPVTGGHRPGPADRPRAPQSPLEREEGAAPEGAAPKLPELNAATVVAPVGGRGKRAGNLGRRRTVLLAALVAALAGYALTNRPASEIVMVDGIPHVDYGDPIGVQENPVIVANWAIDDDGDLLTAAEWLIDHQQPDGSWRYGFDYTVTGRVRLDAGWPSAMAQGRAMEVFAYAYDETGDERYVDAARNAFAFLMVPVSEGGVRSTLDGELWFEEYPTDPPSYVLNGFVYTLMGLWEAQHMVPGARAVYDEARATLAPRLARWDHDGRAVYDLLHESLGGEPMWIPSYDAIHEHVLTELLEHRESRAVLAWRERWR